MKIIITERQSKLLRRVIKENEDKDNTFYHGTGWDITLQNLDMERSNVVQHGRRTGSSAHGTGLYVSIDLWSSQDATYDDDLVKKQGTKGLQSGEKYAKGWSKKSDEKGIWTGDHPIYIYKVKVKPDFNMVMYSPPGYDMRSIDRQQRRELLSQGIDGIDHGDEQLILNKDKIQSITLAYRATKYGTDYLHLPIWEKV